MPDGGHETVTIDIAALIAEERLYPLFQPILDVAKSTIVAHEGLIRGPNGSALHLPSALFPAAIAAGLTNELEFAAARVIFTANAQYRSAGLLFVNFSARSITHLGSDRGRREFQDTLLRCQIPGRSLVIEITEHERVEDHQVLTHAIQFLRSLGVSIAAHARADPGCDPVALRPGDLLIRVKACGLNYFDIFVRRGMPGLPVPMVRASLLKPFGGSSGIACPQAKRPWTNQRGGGSPGNPARNSQKRLDK